MNGITFEQRNVRALDDARIYESLYEDGILRGCAVTFSGASLTIGAGAMLIRGRQFAIDTAQTFAASPTYPNGYGRLKLTIDLAAAPSASSASQWAVSWQYASTNSFAVLVQEDINNGSDTDYEVELCRVKFTAGSIESILSQIGRVAVLSGVFGLGKPIQTGDDLHSYLTPGVFYAIDGQSVINSPSAAAYRLEVIRIAPGVIMHRAYAANQRFYMAVYNGEWSAWESGIKAVYDAPTTGNEGDVFIKV